MAPSAMLAGNRSKRQLLGPALRVPALLLILAGSVWPILIAMGAVCLAISLFIEHRFSGERVHSSLETKPLQVLTCEGEATVYKSDLEKLLTEELREQQQEISEVRLSKDLQFALYNLGDCYTLRRLSPAARQFLEDGDVGRLAGQRLLQ